MTMVWWARVFLPALLAVVSAYGGPTSVGATSPGNNPGIEAFPPMPNDHPPGASRAALDTAGALGRGVNFGAMLEAPNEGDWGLTVRDEFIDVTARAGFATVRLPVRWSSHAAVAAPFAIDPQFFDRVESVLNKLLAKGLYVVLDMHHYLQFDGDALDEEEPAVDRAVVDVRFLSLWQQIAGRFRGKSNHLLFELYNEPHGRHTPATWNVLAARALNVVRRSNPNRIVVIGPTDWNAAGDLPSLRLPNDANLIVTVHNYEPFDFTHQGADWVSPVPPIGERCCDATQQAAAIAPLTMAKAWSDANRYPIFLGEFGAYDKGDMSSRVAFTRLVREQAEARGFSWSYWELAAGFGVYDPAAHAWRKALRDALLGY
jgi:endoglucanase